VSALTNIATQAAIANTPPPPVRGMWGSGVRCVVCDDPPYHGDPNPTGRSGSAVCGMWGSGVRCAGLAAACDVQFVVTRPITATLIQREPKPAVMTPAGVVKYHSTCS
jgi:hypothetical protein